MKRMTLGKAGLLSLAVPALLATWLAAEASTEGSRDNLSATLRSERPNATTVSVRFRDGLLSVEAKAGTWVQVLNEITEQTGIQFHHYLPFAGTVTVSFANLPVAQAIERLFGPAADFVSRYDGTAYSSSSLPKEVWVLGKMQGGGAEGQQSAPANNADVDSSNQAHVGTGRADALAAAAEPPMDTELIDHIVAMSRDEDPQMRRQAIAALTDSGIGDEDSAIGSVLDAALTDDDASVRAYGVQALAIRGGPEVMEHLWRALRDPDAEVRIMAVENAKSQDQGIALLQEALSDVDETIRFVAADRLNQELHRVDTE